MSSKSKKFQMELGPSSEQLEILSVKEDNGQIRIEFRAPNTSAISIAGEPHNNQTHTEIKVEDDFDFGGTSNSAQSIPTTGAEPNNYQTVYGGSTAIKVENEVDIKIEDEMEFCALNSTAQSNPETDDEEHDNQVIQDQFAEIKIEDEMTFGESNISVQSIPTNDAETNKYRTIQDEFAEIEDKMECGVSEGNKEESDLICDICSKKYSTKFNRNKHRLRHGKPNFDCTVCGVAKFDRSKLDRHMRVHDTIRIYFKCDLCPKKYSSKDYLFKHMKTHDTNSIHLTCDFCFKVFSTKNSMTNHRNRHGKPNFNCNICGAAKFSQFDLNRHIKWTHDANKNGISKGATKA